MRLLQITDAKSRRGFTILEVLIALAASLFLMLGLTRAFKMLGDRITESQADLELSSTLRDVSYRLRDELRRATSHMSPPGKTDAGDGYLVYHEGPFTDATTIVGDPASAGSDYYPTSRYGDIDDYLAFTAEAEPGSPFVGFIPDGILQAHRFSTGTMTAAEQSAYTNTQATTRVPFYSRRAEIAYWLAPRWARTAGGGFGYDSGSGYPLYPDSDSDQLPDRLDLHRRVLLIRRDLNMTPAEMNEANGDSAPSPPPADWHVPQLPILIRTNTGLKIQRLTDASGGNQNFMDSSIPLVAPGSWTANMNTNAPNWLTGIARVQQAMDLSVSRVTNHWATPQPTSSDPPTMYGQPSSIVEANSLAGLARPENRFAYVRMPEALVSGAAGSTLPQLALAPPHPYLTVREDAAPYFPAQADHNAGSTGPGPGANNQFKYGRFAMVGFLRPEFCLTDVISDAPAGGSNSVRISRGGSDIVATDLLSFNLQIFDESAPEYVWVGPDGEPGTAGTDDDGDGTTTGDADELGYPNSDDELVTINGLRMYQVITDPATSAQEFFLVDRGGFVDLNYTRLAGGAMGSLIQLDNSTPPNTVATSPTKRGEMVSQISGLGDESTNEFPDSWEMSGRFVISRGSGMPTVSSFYQPVFDTWTNDYGRDAYDQEGKSTASGAFTYGTYSPPTIPAYQERRGGAAASRDVQYRQWSSREGGSVAPAFAGQYAGLNTSTTGSNEPIEVVPPVQKRLKALKISIRAFDAEVGQIRQQTIIEDF